MVTLRRLAPTDLDAIYTIQQASPEAAQWPAAAWLPFCTPCEDEGGAKIPVGHCAWVEEVDGTPVGFLAGLFSGEEMEILNLAVSPGARRAAVASRLLDGALWAARSSGGRRAFLEVRATNAGAIAFYEQHGFLLAGRRRHYYSSPVEDALVLARALGEDD